MRSALCAFHGSARRGDGRESAEPRNENIEQGVVDNAALEGPGEHLTGAVVVGSPTAVIGGQATVSHTTQSTHRDMQDETTARRTANSNLSMLTAHPLESP